MNTNTIHIENALRIGNIIDEEQVMAEAWLDVGGEL
jgi:hypothetical protein